MKKTLVFMLALSLLTACNAEEKASETAEVSEMTEIVTETATETVTETPVKLYDDYICILEDNSQYFESLSEFESYMQSGKMSEDYDDFHYSDGTPVTFDHIEPFIPIFDENKYEITRISLDNIQYGYWFRNIETDERFSATVKFDSYYHTFEELAEYIGVKIELEPDRTTTIWNGISAILQRDSSSPYPRIEHEIYAMLDETNYLRFSGGDTPEKIKTAIEEITFKAIPSAETYQKYYSNTCSWGAEQETVTSTEALIEKETQPLVFYEFSQMINFDTVEEFEDYLNTDQKEKNFPHIFSEKSRDIIGDITLLKPVFDETKYELRGITFVGTSYNYSFRNINTDKFCVAAIDCNTTYHTFEEMVEYSNVNLVIEQENTQTTVWGDTPALVQSVQYSNPVKYFIKAMIDENSSVYLSGGDMTPEELTSTLNDITFE